jgi:hypothetical protein
MPISPPLKMRDPTWMAVGPWVQIRGRYTNSVIAEHDRRVMLEAVRAPAENR